MLPFPEEFEFVDFFEQEPCTLDSEVPFYYNRHTYQLERENGTLHFELEPSYSWVRCQWHQGDIVLIDLTLEEVRGIRLEKRAQREYIHILFANESLMKPLIVKTKPIFSIIWGTEVNC
ncbi:hypothetical protein J2Z69_001984 [Paenibacillus shirakamiensis]|uniref:Uncharacterized protein n=1 Tax=Paenibacillus shirakamiensis TaxID=1265935 RepID=A0ABS4JIJ6_9BACL|nr:hypothetical protein [Paenibacillus shirakamiensis]MBP2000941.1 hypothetical protein [Paenibacillus shirakamiensis]